MRKFTLVKNFNYHIYNRGFYKQRLFIDESDYRFFMFKISQLKQILKIKIYIYCLMPNHYHFLLKCNQNPKKISNFIHRLHIAYARYYNNKYDNSGHVFQGPYQYKPVTTQASFKHLFKYINENPVEAGLVKTPQDWPYTAHYGMV